MSTKGALEIEDLAVSGPLGTIISGVSFRIEPGKVMALTGPSGSGKTTIIHAIVGILGEGLVKSGAIRLGGKVVPQEGLGAPGTISVVSQRPLEALNPAFPADRLLVEVARARMPNVTRIVRERAVDAALSEVGLPGAARRQLPTQLSGGERQRVQLAAALVGDPGLIVADEPTASLDVVARREIFGLIAKVAREHRIPVVVATHDYIAIREFCDSFAILADRSLKEIVSASSLRAEPLPRSPQVEPGPLLLETRGLVKSFGRRKVVDGVSLTLTSGSAIGVVGRSGCGKTTLARCLAGLAAPDAGSISLVTSAGKRSQTGPSPAVQLVFQEPHASFDPRMSLAESLVEVFTLASAGTRAADPLHAAIACLREVGITEQTARRRPREVSGGECQRAAIARALIRPPSLLIADEPTSGLDPVWASRVMNLLREVRARRPFAMLLISHDIRVLAGVCSEIAVMAEGRIVQRETTERLIRFPTHPASVELVQAVVPPFEKNRERASNG